MTVCLFFVFCKSKGNWAGLHANKLCEIAQHIGFILTIPEQLQTTLNGTAVPSENDITLG